VLDIGNNMIEKIENIAHLENLEEFWVSVSYGRRIFFSTPRLLIGRLVLVNRTAGELQQDPGPSRSG
jgi:hypothetical protein